MSEIIENRAHFGNSYCSSIHFPDTSWCKDKTWKVYLGFTLDGHRQGRKVYLRVRVGDPLTEEDCDLVIEMHKLVNNLAKKFCKSDFNSPSIHVLVPDKAMIDKTALVHNMKRRTRKLSRNEWILVFSKMRKKRRTFVKRNGTATTSCDALEAFIHFMYIETRGKHVVSKLSGVQNGSDFTLTDLCLHTNKNDIASVLEKHTCNDICRARGYTNTPLPHTPLPEPLRIQPTAPYEDHSESDEETVFSDEKPQLDNEKSMRFRVMLDSENNYHAVPYFLPADDPTTCPAGSQLSELPKYQLECPSDHTSCGHGGSPRGHAGHGMLQHFRPGIPAHLGLCNNFPHGIPTTAGHGIGQQMEWYMSIPGQHVYQNGNPFDLKYREAPMLCVGASAPVQQFDIINSTGIA